MLRGVTFPFWKDQHVAAPITFVAATTGSGPNPSTSIVINKPAGTVDGDVLICAFFANITAPQTISPPAGWTAGPTLLSTDRFSVFYKVASGEPASYTFTCNGTASWCGVMASYRGVDNATPIDVAGTIANSLTATSVTTLTPNTMLVGLAGASDAVTVITPPGSMTGRGFVHPDGFSNAELADETVPGTGATGTRTWTTTGAGRPKTVLIALKQAP